MNLGRPRDTFRKTPEFSLVFPLYNPGSRLEATLNSLNAFLRESNTIWEIVFVADGCTDDSVIQLRRWAAGYALTRILDYTPNRGKGHAVRQGLLAASTPYRVFTDIDLAYSFADIGRVALALKSGADVAVASRTHANSQMLVTARNIGYAYRRQIQSAAFGLLARTILPLKQRDTQAGLKGLTESVVRRIVPAMKCNGFGFDCELLTACARLNISVKEIPVTVGCDAPTSTTNWRSTVQMVGDLFQIRKNWPADLPKLPSEADVQLQYREAG